MTIAAKLQDPPTPTLQLWNHHHQMKFSLRGRERGKGHCNRRALIYSYIKRRRLRRYLVLQTNLQIIALVEISKLMLYKLLITKTKQQIELFLLKNNKPNFGN